MHRTGWAYVWVATELEQIGSASSAMRSTHQKNPNGDYVVSKESLLYLGSFLCDNGSIGPELNRRLGAARGGI